MFIKFIWNFLFISLFLSSVNATARADIFQENCGESPSDIALSLSDILSSSAQNNPFRRIEHCLVYTMDESLKPLCDQAKVITTRIKACATNPHICNQGHSYNDERTKILEILILLEQVKTKYANIFYEAANDLDETLTTLLQDGPTTTEVATDTSSADNTIADAAILDVLIPEQGHFKDIVRIKALNLCGSTLERTAEEGV